MIEVQNEYLSDERWQKLLETVATAMTPVLVSQDREVLGAIYDRAANALADLGVMPESSRADCAA